MASNVGTAAPNVNVFTTHWRPSLCRHSHCVRVGLHMSASSYITPSTPSTPFRSCRAWQGWCAEFSPTQLRRRRSKKLALGGTRGVLVTSSVHMFPSDRFSAQSDYARRDDDRVREGTSCTRRTIAHCVSSVSCVHTCFGTPQRETITFRTSDGERRGMRVCGPTHAMLREWAHGRRAICYDSTTIYQY